MPTGQDFIRHEFDEAIAVQQSIVRGAGELAQVHPLPDGRRQLKTAARASEQWLRKLEKRGQAFGATGEKEEVAGAMDQLATTTLENARQGEPSEVYEAQAVVINALRKQQDAAGSIIKIARSLKDRDLAIEAREMQKASKTTADGLAKNLTELAVVIATEGTNGRSPSRGRTTVRSAAASRAGAKSRSSATARSGATARSSTAKRGSSPKRGRSTGQR